MDAAIVTVPNAFLYETSCAEHVSDELLSGWIVTVRNRQGDFLEVTTDYGYTGWLRASAVRKITAGECCIRDFKGTGNNSVSPAVLCRGITDILEKPRVQSAVLSTLFMGSHVWILGRPEDGWQRIKMAGGICGYVPAVSLLLSGRNFSEFSGNCRNGRSGSLAFSNGNFSGSATDCSASFSCSNLRQKVLHYAKSYLGVQYRWGGKTHAGIDCSGLAFMSYYMCGIAIYRDAAIMEGYPVREIPLDQIRPADLIYFPGHVALYLGNGEYIHSTGNLADFGCTINSLNPYSSIYRKDLAENITAAGSVFCVSKS